MLNNKIVNIAWNKLTLISFSQVCYLILLTRKCDNTVSIENIDFGKTIPIQEVLKCMKYPKKRFAEIYELANTCSIKNCLVRG